ncbi:uncharacterized protein OCT59_025454 [Rhizophagus irregularis]|uniref:uncharacterized protein n=1 Tax=Rhizophagus irregularis TaxID=588596 RepID=UPI00331876FC|nr:hypothetical protein OCT59_025454 [Rhizophagus irregularis]
MSYQDNDDQCTKCGEKYENKYDAKYKWCKSCQLNNLKKNFINWTSDNERIDNLIQEMQLEINELDDVIFEWIPFDQFNNIKEIDEEGLDKVYSAIWKDGPLNYDEYKNEYTRNQPNKRVALKLYNLKNIIDEFFIDQPDQGKKYSTTYIEFLRMYGISQYPNTLDYIIVLQEIYCKKCVEMKKIDNLIQKLQLNINYNTRIIFEWIPYDQLSDIHKISEDDIDTLYSAKWNDGPLYYNEKKWTKKSNKVVTLKYLYDSPNVINLLNKIYCDYIYGISQNPYTEEYIMIFPNIYCKKCNKQYEKYSAIWKDGPLNYDKIKNKYTRNKQDIKVTLKLHSFRNINNEFLNKFKEDLNKYHAIWNNGPLCYYDKKWTRESYKKVFLVLYYLQNTNEFLNKVKKYLSDNNNPIYGISQSQDARYYIIVFRYKLYCVRCGEEYMELDIEYEWSIWKNDFYYCKYLYEKEYIRKLKSKVVLKYSQDITYEVEKYSSHKKYGISQDYTCVRNYFSITEIRNYVIL